MVNTNNYNGLFVKLFLKVKSMSFFSYAHGHIVATELDGMPKTDLHHYWTKVPVNLNLKSGEDSLTKAFVTSLSIAQTDAWRNFDMALKMSPNMLLSDHVTVGIN